MPASSPPLPFKKTYPCTILPPLFLVFQIPFPPKSTQHIIYTSYKWKNWGEKVSGIPERSSQLLVLTDEPIIDLQPYMQFWHTPLLLDHIFNCSHFSKINETWNGNSLLKKANAHLCRHQKRRSETVYRLDDQEVWINLKYVTVLKMRKWYLGKCNCNDILFKHIYLVTDAHETFIKLSISFFNISDTYISKYFSQEHANRALYVL